MNVEQTICSIQVGIWKVLQQRGENVAFPRTLKMTSFDDPTQEVKEGSSSSESVACPSSTEHSKAADSHKFHKIFELLFSENAVLETESLKEMYGKLSKCKSVSEAADVLDLFEQKLFPEETELDSEDVKLDVLYLDKEVAAGTWEDPSAPHATVSDLGLLDTPKDFVHVPFTTEVIRKTSKDLDTSVSSIIFPSGGETSSSNVQVAPSSCDFPQDPVESAESGLALLSIRKVEERSLDLPESSITVQDSGMSKEDVLCQGDSARIPNVQLVKEVSKGEEPSNVGKADESVGKADVDSGEKDTDAVV